MGKLEHIIHETTEGAYAPPFNPSGDLMKRYRSVSAIASLITLAVGLIVLLGWMFDIPAFKMILPGFITMKANTAIGFTLTGLSLWLLQTKRTNRKTRRVAQWCALIVAAIGFLTVVEYVFGLDLGIDQLFFTEAKGAVLTPYLGRPAPVTALNFLFIGVAILLIDLPRAYPLAQGLIFIEGAVSLISVFAYLFGVPRQSTGFFTYYAIAVPTALTFIAVFVGIVFSRPDRGWVSILASKSQGGVFMRRILPVIILLPPAVSMMSLWGEMAGLYDTRFGVAFHSVMITAIMALLVAVLAKLMDRDDIGRKRAEEALREYNEKLQKTLAELEQAHVMLVRTEKLSSLGTLSAGVAHEILNPLNIIGTIVQMEMMKGGGEEQRENMEEIMVQVRRATKIANNLRIFSRKEKKETKAVNFNNLLDYVAELFEYDLRLDNIRIIRDYDPNLPDIVGNEDELAQVVMNQLTNARDALQPRRKGVITFHTRAIAGGIVVRFADDGPGIPEDAINNVFDPFFTTKDAGKGTGLGLSVAHSIIEEHKGTFCAKNGENGGACFTITLPIGGDAIQHVA